MGMSISLKNNLLNNWFRNTAYDMPDTFYLGLSKTEPAEDGTNVTEPDATSYKRLAITADEVNWTEADGGYISNAAILRFTEAETAWSTTDDKLTHYVIYDSETDGELLFYGALTREMEVPESSVVEIPIGGLQTGIVNIV